MTKNFTRIWSFRNLTLKSKEKFIFMHEFLELAANFQIKHNQSIKLKILETKWFFSERIPELRLVLPGGVSLPGRGRRGPAKGAQGGLSALRQRREGIHTNELPPRDSSRPRRWDYARSDGRHDRGNRHRRIRNRRLWR